MRTIDADALKEEVQKRAQEAARAGDGQAAGMFLCMALIIEKAPTLEEGRETKRTT